MTEGTLVGLLGGTAVGEFLERYYTRVPFSRPGGAQGLVALASWELLERILLRPAADVVVARAGERWPGPGRPSPAEARALRDQGYTVSIRNAERSDEALARLAADFARELGGAVNVHLYCTPAERRGFGWHYDAEEVFLIQTAGRKTYYLRKNTVNPWPLEETLPDDMRYERETTPVLACTLAAGDWLYVPSGWWHVGEAEEAATSLAVGVMPRAAVAVYDWLRSRLLGSLVWRQRLPVLGTAAAKGEEALAGELSALFVDLGRDLARTLRAEETARDYLRAVRGG